MRWLAVAGLLVGCYRPDADRACVTRCDPAEVGQNNACPGSLVCAADGMCRAPDGSCSVGPVADGDVDTVPGDSGAFCYGQGLVRICLPTEPTGVRALPATIDTNTNCDSSVFQTNGPEACLVTAQTISLMNVRVTGTRPLVVLASNTITLAGTIDVASRRGQTEAAGSNEATCQGTANPVVSAGGNGGSLAGLGGKGGRGGINPAPAVDPMVLRGGCPGQIGNGNPLAIGGRGGGAIYFIAGSMISIGNAAINASGAGGSAAPMSGGGGGGSGGMIGFDAPSISALSGALAFANGGGGAGGSTDSNQGSDGGEPTSHTTAGLGGVGASGATGGDGSLSTVDGASGAPGTAVGGGGGGGAGVIVIYPVSQANVFGGRTSPAVTQ